MLPAITLGASAAGILARMTRASLLEVLGSDYVRTARAKGLRELAVVLRHTRAAPIRTRHKHTGNVATFRSDQRAWYEAYERDLDGQPIDDVMDWAAMEQDVLGQDKALATLLVLAAEAVKYDRRAPDYWTAERRWQAGDTTTLVQQSTDKVRRALAS